MSMVKVRHSSIDSNKDLTYRSQMSTNPDGTTHVPQTSPRSELMGSTYARALFETLSEASEGRAVPQATNEYTFRKPNPEGSASADIAELSR